MYKSPYGALYKQFSKERVLASHERSLREKKARALYVLCTICILGVLKSAKLKMRCLIMARSIDEGMGEYS